MECKLPFKLIFSPDYSTETEIKNFVSGEVRGIPFFKATYEKAEIYITFLKEKGWQIRVFNSGDNAITGFWGIRFPWKYGDDAFTLVPGVYYDGNVQENINTIPLINLPDSPKFSAPISAMSFPAVLAKDGTMGKSYEISHKTVAGWNGIELDGDKETLTFFAPAKEEKKYTLKAFNELSRPAYTLNPKCDISFTVNISEFSCEKITDLFDYYWNDTIRSKMHPAFNSPKILEDEGSALVRDWVYERHCVRSSKNEAMILNAFTDLEGSYPYKNVSAGWNVLIGWCSGTMTALPLLKFGGKYRDFAIEYIDFLAENGNSPCGIKYPVYDGNVWLTKGHWNYQPSLHDHCRLYSEYIYYLGRAIRFEKENGFTHKNWENDFKHGIDIILNVWKENGAFKTYWDISGETVKIYGAENAAGAYPTLAMGEALIHFPENEELKSAFMDSCKNLYDKFIFTGRCNGGPSDIKGADDSESCAALCNVLVLAYQITKNREFLDMALDAAKLFSTWVVNYIPPFPEGSLNEGLNVCGGVIANVQNRHIGPGICTNSARFIYDLGEITGDNRWKELYYNIKNAAINCITLFDGEFCDTTPDLPFYKGMLTEQINITDALRPAGTAWRVSACWPATSVLLGWFDKP